MPLLTTGEIARMRETVEETFDATAIIQERGFASDGGGGGTASWVASGTVPCHLAPIILRGGSEHEPVTGGRIDPAASWTVIFPAETDVSTDARILIGDRTFEAVALEAPRSMELSRRVQAKEVT